MAGRSHVEDRGGAAVDARVGSTRGPPWLTVVLVLVMVAPAVAAIASLAGRSWYPTDDFAVIDLRVRDVFTTHTPLTGLYSRPGWNHPGPLMFWGMAPLSWLSGQATWATRVGGAVLQGIAIVWLGVVTARRGLRLLLAAAVVTSFTYLAHQQSLFREPWNLHIPVPYFVLFLFLTLLVATGSSRQVIGMSIAACMLVETHLGYTPLVVAGFGYALGWLAFDAWRDRRLPARWKSTLVISLVIWAVAWAAPIADVVLHWPGNLGKIASYFLARSHSQVGLQSASGFMADQFRFVPAWLGGTQRTTLFTGSAVEASAAWFLVPLVMLGLASVAAHNSRIRDDARMLGLAVLVLVAGVFAISGADEPRAYTFQWRSTVAAFLVVTCVWTIAGAVAGHVGRAVRVSAVAVAAGLAVWGGLTMTTAVVRGPSAFLTAREPDLRQMMAVVHRRPRPRGILRVRMPATSGASLFDGVVDQLDRLGVDVRVDPLLGRRFGDQRTVSPSRRAPTWYVTQRGSDIPGLLARPGARLVAATTPLTPAEDAELTQIQTRVRAAIDRAGIRRQPSLDSAYLSGLVGIPGISRHDLVRMAQLNAIVERRFRCRCAIVAVPPR